LPGEDQRQPAMNFTFGEELLKNGIYRVVNNFIE